MTALTLFAILALVPFLAIVVLAVAGMAVLWRLLVIAVLMAISTLGLNVLSRQRESRCVMVKFRLFPQILVMAVGTLDAQRTLVHVVFSVACVALQGRVAKLFPGGMALGTFHLLMLCTQCEVGRGMVKFGLIKVGNQGHPTFVIGMAGATGFGAHLAVKTGLTPDIQADILVAGHAQAVLGLAVKLHMTLLALVLDLDMALDYLARRDDRLDALRLGTQRKEAARHQPQ